MAAGNTISVVGNVTRDPELAFTNNGRALTSFGIAYNKRWKNSQSGEWEEEAHFFDVVCWGDMAENVAESINKGDRVLVEGWMQQRSWEDKDGGGTRSKHEIVADEVCPSLKWATATISRVQRDSGGSGGGDRSRSGSSRGQGGRSGQGRGGRQASTDLYSEEPF